MRDTARTLSTIPIYRMPPTIGERSEPIATPPSKFGSVHKKPTHAYSAIVRTSRPTPYPLDGPARQDRPLSVPPRTPRSHRPHWTGLALVLRRHRPLTHFLMGNCQGGIHPKIRSGVPLDRVGLAPLVSWASHARASGLQDGGVTCPARLGRDRLADQDRARRSLPRGQGDQGNPTKIGVS
jgi:hypothetical protein